MGTCCQPIDGANDTLVHLRVALKVRIIRLRQGKGINGQARAVRGHVGNTVHFVDAESVGSKFGEGRLAKMHGDVTIVMA